MAQAPPPPAPHGYPPPARPGGVTAAGVLLIVLGSFAALGGVFLLISVGILAGTDLGPLEEQFGGFFSAVAGVAVLIGILVLVYAVFKIIAGAKVFRLRNGWRIAGIVLCAIAIVGWIISLIGAIQGTQQTGLDPATLEFIAESTGPNIGGIILAVIFLGLNTTALILLARSGQAFRR